MLGVLGSAVFSHGVSGAVFDFCQLSVGTDRGLMLPDFIDPQESPVMKIMIAYDGSRNAKMALVQTITMFRDLDLQLALVAVAENPRDITSDNDCLLYTSPSPRDRG